MKHRAHPPQLDGGFFLTDGGTETTLIFHEGWDLPHFASFDLLKSIEGERALDAYYRTYAEIARRVGAGLILESPTWRASADWGEKLGYSAADLAAINRKAIHLLERIRNEYETKETPVVISGCLGPRGDGYIADSAMSAEEAAEYHRAQIATFADTGADMVCAMTMNYVEEAIGIALAAQRAAMPVALSFTVETDGALPTGRSLREAIEETDRATSGYPAYYMINCAHPTHFLDVLAEGGAWLDRIRGVRANASRQSHAELNEAPELDAGDPVELGLQYAEIRRLLAHCNVMGGCCGTDHRHIERIAECCAPLFRGAESGRPE